MAGSPRIDDVKRLLAARQLLKPIGFRSAEERNLVAVRLKGAHHSALKKRRPCAPLTRPSTRLCAKQRGQTARERA